MSHHDSSGRPWATTISTQTPLGNTKETPSGHTTEMPSGTKIETLSGINTSRLTDSSGTTRLTPLGYFFLNNLVNTQVTNYMVNYNINIQNFNGVDTCTGTSDPAFM